MGCWSTVCRNGPARRATRAAIRAALRLAPLGAAPAPARPAPLAAAACYGRLLLPAGPDRRIGAPRALRAAGRSPALDPPPGAGGGDLLRRPHAGPRDRPREQPGCRRTDPPGSEAVNSVRSQLPALLRAGLGNYTL